MAFAGFYEQLGSNTTDLFATTAYLLRGTPMFNKSLLAVTLVLAITVTASASITRTRVENFTVDPGAHIDVKINGGSINVKIGASGQVRVEVIEVAKTDSETEADEMISKSPPIIEITAQGGVRVALQPENLKINWFGWHGDRGVQYNVNLTMPAKADLNLDTSGGNIKVDGEVEGELRANTSGGSIRVTGGVGKINLDTSGGGITVDRVLQQLHADTSGGSIHVGYVSPTATDVNVDTSGGGINIGLDPAGNYDLDADTSGGSVNVSGLTFDAHRKDRTHAQGKINKGGAPVHADTSGGSIDVHAAQP